MYHNFNIDHCCSTSKDNSVDLHDIIRIMLFITIYMYMFMVIESQYNSFLFF